MLFHPFGQYVACIYMYLVKLQLPENIDYADI